MTNQENRIVVEFVINVDCPELRGPSFDKSEPHKIVVRLYPKSRPEALRVVKAILAGEEDFSSEFASRVQAFFQGGRYIRKMHVRSARDAEWIQVA